MIRVERGGRALRDPDPTGGGGRGDRVRDPEKVSPQLRQLAGTSGDPGAFQSNLLAGLH